MKKTAKTWLITAAALLVIGTVVFASAMFALGWDFKKLSTVNGETKTFEIDEKFTSVEISAITEDVEFAFSNDGKCKVVCFEENNLKHTAEVKDGKLKVTVKDERKWLDFVGINFNSNKITVFLPKSEYQSFKIDSKTGEIFLCGDFKVDNVSVSVKTGEVNIAHLTSSSIEVTTTTGEIEISDLVCSGYVKTDSTTGDVELENVICKGILSSGTTGEVSLEDVIAREYISIERSTGEIEVDKCDAPELYLKTTTGDVCGSLLSEKIFITQTTTGRVSVPKSASGGKCEIKTTTGDIEFE